MHIPDCSKGSVEVECGGFANVSHGTYEGRRVAIKVMRMYITSDLDVILGVSTRLAPSHLSERMDHSDSVERALRGNTSGIPISYLCSV